MQGLLITGTDTGVGKTFVACGIVAALRQQGIRVGAYKPVCSGGEARADGTIGWPDVEALAEALGPAAPSERICPQRFIAPLAPPSAAALERRSVDERQLFEGINAWRQHADLLIIEGVGGLLCPLSQNMTLADFGGRIGVPLVVVAALRLGVVNHTLLTLEVARHRGLTVAGVLLNEIGPDDGSNASSIAEISARGEVNVLGVLPSAADRRSRPEEPMPTRTPSPRPSPPNHAADRGEDRRGGEGDERDVGLRASARKSMRHAADESICRLRRPEILSRIDWSGLGAELSHF
jgi:dethiobiotin synthetase